MQRWLIAHFPISNAAQDAALRASATEIQPVYGFLAIEESEPHPEVSFVRATGHALVLSRTSILPMLAAVAHKMLFATAGARPTSNRLLDICLEEETLRAARALCETEFVNRVRLRRERN